MDVQLLLGDCLELMKGLPDQSVDLVVTSPPYDGLRKYNGYSFDFESIAPELLRVVAPGGVVVWIVGDATKDGTESGTSFRQALHFKAVGFNLHDTMFYEKVNYVPLTHNRYEQAIEYMFVLSKGKPKAFNPIRVPKVSDAKPGRFFKKAEDSCTSAASSSATSSDDKIAPNVWRYTVGGGKTGHPAVFPKKLAQDHVLSWSNEGDVVLDPFMGSGTTGLACISTNRNFIGMEVSQQYFSIAEGRISQAQGANGRVTA